MTMIRSLLAIVSVAAVCLCLTGCDSSTGGDGISADERAAERDQPKRQPPGAGVAPDSRGAGGG